MYYSATSGGFYDPAIHGHNLPNDAKQISPQVYQQLLAAQAGGKLIIADSDGFPTSIDPLLSTDDLCNRIDTAADAARRAVAGDPLRAVEYDRARLAAEQFAAAGYEGEVPAMVAAWAINGRTPQQAADSILAEAAAYTHALELLRTTRLAAKEQIRTLMAANQVDQAQQVADQTIASIEAAVAGIGNNS